MLQLNRWWCFALCAVSTAGVAHAQDASITASRVALEVEWIRSPRAVVSLGNEFSTQQRALAVSPQGAKPVVLETDPGRDGARHVWSLEPSEKRLSSALERWAQLAGWQLVWEVERDFVIESSLHLEGEFLKAVSTVMQTLSKTDYPLQAKANSATLTLRITRYQDAGAQ